MTRSPNYSTQVHKHEVFIEMVKINFPGAKTWTEVRGWEDPKPLHYVEFKNGVRFESNDMLAVFDKAKAYFTATIRLTGEAP